MTVQLSEQQVQAIKTNPLAKQAWKLINDLYTEDDRIDAIFIEDGDLFVTVNHGNVGSGAINERYRL